MFLGYLSIQLLGLALGTCIFPPPKIKSKDKPEKEKKARRIDDIIIELFAYSILYWSVLFALSFTELKVSRQIVRAPYPSPPP